MSYEAEQAYDALHDEYKALLVERDFWRRATELALRAMSDAEDKLEETRAIGRRAAYSAKAYIELVISDLDPEDESVLLDLGQVEVWLEQLAPPADDAPPENVG